MYSIARPEMYDGAAARVAKIDITLCPRHNRVDHIPQVG